MVSNIVGLMPLKLIFVGSPFNRHQQVEGNLKVQGLAGVFELLYA